jgi:hypothetical protein
MRSLWLAGLVSLAACPTRPKPAESRGPFLSIFQPEAPAGALNIVTPAAVALALGGLPPDELPRLRAHLSESTDGALRRAAPELFDLDGRVDGDAGVDALRQMLPDLPALTAAANLSGSPWETQSISVHLGPSCEPGASRCTPLFVPPAAAAGDALVRRGRVLAWAWGNAALLRVLTSGREGLVRALRAAQLHQPGTVAVVFGASQGTLDAVELDRLRSEARRALAQLAPNAPQRAWLEALDTARPDWHLPVPLEPDQVLVIPRLSALARLQDFASEVESAGSFEWVVRPGDQAAGRR